MEEDSDGEKVTCKHFTLCTAALGKRKTISFVIMLSMCCFFSQEKLSKQITGVATLTPWPVSQFYTVKPHGLLPKEEKLNK